MWWLQWQVVSAVMGQWRETACWCVHALPSYMSGFASVYFVKASVGLCRMGLGGFCLAACTGMTKDCCWASGVRVHFACQKRCNRVLLLLFDVNTEIKGWVLTVTQ